MELSGTAGRCSRSPGKNRYIGHTGIDQMGASEHKRNMFPEAMPNKGNHGGPKKSWEKTRYGDSEQVGGMCRNAGETFVQMWTVKKRKD